MALSVITRQVLRFPAGIPQHILSLNGVNAKRGLSNTLLHSNLLRPKLISQVATKRLMSGDHAKKWKLEKILTIIMFPIIPATFNNPGTEILDNLFAILLTTHAHFGLEAIAKDYLRPIVVGPALSKIAVGVVYALTATTLGGLLYFNHHNIGIGAAGRQIWSIGKEKKEVA
ncbi:putative succinate dehydrogenase [ubiquinone] cytochrome b small subunit, mitochondrial [Harmonia axyridis]|uniref:putative succinate dehydrogenase [ubiquinone] cytochrome b small subunit, mitochondrial n=1 Tax=Harmonia axyridis TaxID=115357 RepID=UPI001E274FC9|nr:putative succinate dehydrogenase [ubiquinone] cytochrome b small subunit, mitochondrial [Harmonia axyridis]